MNRCAIITYKHGIFELPHELPNDLKLSPIVHGGSDVALKHGGGVNLPPVAKIQTTKAVDLKLGTLIK